MVLILKECCYNCDVKTYQSIRALEADDINYKEFDLLISDIELPGEDTFSFFGKLRHQYSKLPILVVSMHKKIAVIKKCRSLGVEGYLLKDEDEQLTKAIEIIINGGSYFSNSITEFCQTTNLVYKKLSEREEEIIKLIANGDKTKPLWITNP